MSTLPETPVAHPWDDPALAGAILKKGERRPRKPAEPKPIYVKPPMIESHCGKPVRDCKCSMWDKGKPPKVSSTPEEFWS